MQAISALQHTRSIQKINDLCQALERAGISPEELIQKRNELQQLYESHHQLIADLNKNADDYYKHFKVLRQNYQLQKKKMK